MLSNGLWPPVYGNSCSTWVILSFPHFAEWTSMLTYVLRSIWCCREINKKNTCILPCQFRVNTHLPIVIIRFAWLHFIFKPSIVNNKKNRKSSKDRLFWHYDGKNATYVDILFLVYWCPTALRKKYRYCSFQQKFKMKRPLCVIMVGNMNLLLYPSWDNNVL